MEKFKTCICIIHASTQTGIVDACLLDSFTCLLHFLPLKGLEKETTQTAELLSHFYLFKLYQNNRTYYETLFFILNTTFFIPSS